MELELKKADKIQAADELCFEEVADFFDQIICNDLGIPSDKFSFDTLKDGFVLSMLNVKSSCICLTGLTGIKVKHVKEVLMSLVDNNYNCYSELRAHLNLKYNHLLAGDSNPIELVRGEVKIETTNDFFIFNASINRRILVVSINVIQFFASFLLDQNFDRFSCREMSHGDKLKSSFVYYPLICMSLAIMIAKEVSSVTKEKYAEWLATTNVRSKLRCSTGVRFAVLTVFFLPVVFIREVYVLSTILLTGGVVKDISIKLGHAWCTICDVLLSVNIIYATFYVIASQTLFISMLFQFAGVVVILRFDDLVASSMSTAIDVHRVTYVDTDLRELIQKDDEIADKTFTLTIEVIIFFSLFTCLIVNLWGSI